MPKKMGDNYRRNVVRKHLLGIGNRLVQKDLWFFDQIIHLKDEDITIQDLMKNWFMKESSARRKLVDLSATNILKLKTKTPHGIWRINYKEYLLLKEMQSAV